LGAGLEPRRANRVADLKIILWLGLVLGLGCWALNLSGSIDEALTLAKELSTDESAGYIHGVLGRISSIKESIAI
jgi:hypothetical protein